MTIQWGDTGRVVYGVLKTVNVTPYVSEQNITSTSLPTAMSTGSPQVSYTISTSTYVPSFSGVIPLSYKPVYGINVSGQNASGVAATVNYQVNKNGTSYRTGNASITNNNYFTLSIFDGSFVNGDVIDVYLWTSASSGVNYMYKNVWCNASRIDTGAKNIINFTTTSTTPASSTYFPLTAKVGGANIGNIVFFPSTSTSNSIGFGNGTAINFPLLSVNSTYKFFQLNYGDGAPHCDLNQSATNYPFISGNCFAPSFSYRELLR